MLDFQTDGDNITFTYPTSKKADGTYRMSTEKGIGGTLETMDDGSSKSSHLKNIENMVRDFNIYMPGWEMTKFCYLKTPRVVVALVENGEHFAIYRYKATLAPGSGQTNYLVPAIDNTRIPHRDFRAHFVGLMIKNGIKNFNQFTMRARYEIMDLVNEGVEFDMAVAAHQLMR